jgi:hypothetical protein
MSEPLLDLQTSLYCIKPKSDKKIFEKKTRKQDFSSILEYFCKIFNHIFYFKNKENVNMHTWHA